MDYRLQFKPEDVVKKAEEWKQKCENDEKFREFIGVTIRYDLQSASQALFDLTYILSEDYRMVDGWVLEDKLQRAYANNMRNLDVVYRTHCDNLLDTIIGIKNESGGIMLLGGKFHDSLNGISEYSPITPEIKKLGELTEKQEEMCERSDYGAWVLVYNSNKLFSQEFQRDGYHLGEDFKQFKIDTIDLLFKKEGILLKPGLVDLVTKVDYQSRVIEPLVWNAREHAFKGEGKKEIDFDGKSESKSEKGNFVIEIKDNGSGIPAEILPHIFEEGFTTKKDKSTKHGIGLSAVKKFVEEQGGTITVESELGKGTIFKFTIPYSHLEYGGVCVQ